MITSLFSRLSIPAGLIIVVQVLAIVASLLVSDVEGARVRIKDISTFQNVRATSLLGYGLVVGLDGTGDGNGTGFTNQSLANMMQRMGLRVEPKKVKVKNVAAVMITARLSSNLMEGAAFDVTVSSIGDASSLQGGTLLLAPLSEPNGIVRATSQGQVSIGGFNVQVDETNRIVNNYTLVGRVPGGGTVTLPLEDSSSTDSEIFLSLAYPDFTTAHRVAERINIKYGLTAYPVAAGSVRIVVPDTLAHPNLRMKFLSDIGHLQVVPDYIARVVINERTGTIVAGHHVTIAPVAIAHGTITVSIRSRPVISQPEPFSDGETIFTQESEIRVDQQNARVVHLKESVHLSDVAGALNKIGATPRDIVAIFQALKQAGALRAELVII